MHSLALIDLSSLVLEEENFAVVIKEGEFK
jgi:hypothetical protein